MIKIGTGKFLDIARDSPHPLTTFSSSHLTESPLATRAADFRPDLECLGPGSSMLGGRDMIAAEVEQVIAQGKGRVVVVVFGRDGAAVYRVFAAQFAQLGYDDLGLRRLGTKSSQTCMGLFLSSSHFWLFGDSLFGAGMPFFVPSPAIRFAERAEGVKGPKR